MESWVSDIDFERPSALRRMLKKAVLNPLANYLPSGLWRSVLRYGQSELAAANWSDPGGWRSMVISYHNNPRQVADRLLVSGGSIPMALRNRKRLGARLLARLIDESPSDPVNVLCLGAGPGHIIIEAMQQTSRPVRATLVDLSNDAFAYGQELAAQHRLGDRVRYIQGDVRDVKDMLDQPPDVVKMLGICEYLTDAQIVAIIRAVSDVAPPGCALVFNSLSKLHGTDRFFRRVFGLHMTHRSPRELQALVAQGGFGDFTAFPEPLGVYHVIVGRKSAEGEPAERRT